MIAAGSAHEAHLAGALGGEHLRAVVFFLVDAAGAAVERGGDLCRVHPVDSRGCHQVTSIQYSWPSVALLSGSELAKRTSARMVASLLNERDHQPHHSNCCRDCYSARQRR